MESSNPNPNTSPAVGVPVSARQPHYPAQPTDTVPWTTGLCDCFEDVPNCCLTFWCPCITFGQIAEIVDQGASSCGVNGALYLLIGLMSVGLTGLNCACFYSCFYRTHMRRQYSLEESPCGDCLLHCLCEPCALCQEHRELKIRGYDMAIGWHGNVKRQRQRQMQNSEIGMGSVPPVVEDGMSRDQV